VTATIKPSLAAAEEAIARYTLEAAL